MKGEFHVEFKALGTTLDWAFDNEYDSLGEAMAHAAEEALKCPEVQHRIIQRSEVMVFPAMKEALK